MPVLRRAVALSIATGLLAVSTRRAVTSSGTIDVVTYHNDVARTGQNLNETILTPASVNVATFGRTGLFAVDGKVDAQPLYLSAVAIPAKGTHDVLYVATEHDSVYALDAVSGTVLWRTSLLGAGETTSDTRSCGQVTPEIGITATPVIDRSRGTNGIVYAVAMSKNSSGTYFQRLHALDAALGTEMFGGPLTIQATFPGTGAGSANGTVTFDAKQYEERSGLLLLNGRIITVWTSHCDIDPYTGWIMAFDAATLAQTSVLNVTPNGSRGGLWMAGAGPAADAQGNVYVLDGNGTFDTTLTAGFPNRGNFGNAFLKIATAGALSVADYFATFDTVSASNADTDLGSGGALVLPDLIDGSGATRHLAVGAGKDSHIYVVDRDAMGKWNASSNLNYQDITGALGGSVFSMPAYFNNTLYYGASGRQLKAFRIASARIAASASSVTAASFAFPGTTPGISASGTANAIVWAVENKSPAVLHAYDAGDLSHELYNSTQAPASRDAFGSGNKFITPTIVDGHVFVGTPNGVASFGLLAPSAPTGLRITGE
ncbi:MAG TPA: hypothetical protein VKH42_00890 [Vicinamibacterales bacterium]|nr:hypothetical protein [Vicinamibacterales bacterium]